MKIQLDIENKTIKLEENVKLDTLVKTLNKLLPGEWKNFTLETNTTISYWTNPIIYKEIIKEKEQYYPSYPWYCTTNGSGGVGGNSSTSGCNTGYSLKQGVYNVEV